jgi:argininosuccinate lyase
MTSKVSRRLTEPVSPEVCEHIYAPRLERDFRAVFPYMSDINQAHVLMLAAQKLIDSDAARALASGLIKMETSGPAAVELDPQREDSYFNYEAHLIGLIGPDAGGRMHIARSRNDLGATLDRMRARDAILDISAALCDIQDHALNGAIQFRHVVMPGYTHLQPAQPITYGFYLSGIAAAFERDAQRLMNGWASTNLNPLGAGALAGTTFDIDRALTSKLLGFDGLLENALDAVASRDFGLELLANLSQIAVGWSRVVQDYYVMVSHEFQTIEFPDRVTGTSSIMPQKKNPVVLEHLKGKAGHLLGLFVTASTALKGTNFTNTIDGNRESMRALFEATEEAKHCLPLFDLVVSCAKPNAALMARRVSEDFASATDLADELVRSEGLSFREAHHIVGGVVRQAMDLGLSADGITSAMIDEAARQQIGKELHLSADHVRRCLDPEASLASRRHPGGPAPAEVERAVLAARERLERRREQLASRRSGLEAARANLKQQIRALAS